MTDQFSMFGAKPKPAATPEPLTPEVNETPRPQFGSNVARAIETKYGPFRRVREGQRVDEFYILELRNGSIVEQTTGGEMRQADIARGGVEPARRLIETSIASGMWKVVR